MNKINHRFQRFHTVCSTLVRIQNSNDVIRYLWSTLTLTLVHILFWLLVRRYGEKASLWHIWSICAMLLHKGLDKWVNWSRLNQSCQKMIQTIYIEQWTDWSIFFQLLPTKRLKGSSWVSQAKPKSVSFASMLVKSTIIFSGLISLWKIPCSSHWIVASRICVKNRLPSSSVIPPSTSMMSNRSEESSGRSST